MASTIEMMMSQIEWVKWNRYMPSQERSHVRVLGVLTANRRSCWNGRAVLACRRRHSAECRVGRRVLFGFIRSTQQPVTKQA